MSDTIRCTAFAVLFSRSSALRFCAAAAFLLATIVPRAALADAGDLDPTFGTAGKAVTDFGAEEAASDLVLDAKGRILVVGRAGPFFSRDVLVVRYDAKGKLDDSFGSGGRVVTDLGNDETASDVAIQGDGKILVLGESTRFSEENEFLGSDLLLIRYRADGAPDGGFGDGDGGIVTAADFSSAAGVAVLRSGKIIVGGSLRTGEGTDFALLRYESDGDLDEGFGDEGVAILDLGANDQLASLAVQRNGKIVIAGDFAAPFEEGTDFVVARFDAGGALDASFGDGGVVTRGFNEFEDTAAVAIARNGKIVVAGTSAEFDGPDQAIIFRYDRDGSPDESLGAGGTAGGFIGSDVGQHESVFGLALAHDGRIVVTGEVINDDEEEEEENTLVARFERDGDLDPRFGEAGLAPTDFDPRGVVIDRKGRIVVAGTAGEDIAVARYLAR